MESTGTKAVELTREQLLARIAELERKQSSRGSLIKLGDKGNIVTYGHGKYPTSLYLSQAETIMQTWGENYVHLKAFIEANRAKLSVKPEKA